MKISIRHWLIGLSILTTLSCSVLSSGSPLAGETLPAPTEDTSLPQDAAPDFFRGVPIMPGAISITAVGDSYIYQIEASVLEVQQYYLREMPLAGWELADQTGDASQGEFSVRLRYIKGDNRITVFITPAGEELVQVLIM
jgi:hypothetical protein